MSDEEVQTPFTGTRRGDGGTYLIVADGSEEFSIAAHYAARIAVARRAAVAIAHIINLDDFVHWGKVEAMMRRDLRNQAEKEIWQVSKALNEEYAIYPSLYIREGQVAEKIIEIIEEDKTICGLILASSDNSSNPGPLISYFTGKGLNKLKIPMIIVPGHLDKEAINAIT